MAVRTVMVRVGQMAVGGEDDVLVTLGLGSCVAIMLHDPKARVGGMAHILLPAPPPGREAPNPAKYASTALPLLIEEIARVGGSPDRLRARLAGGASMFSTLLATGAPTTGERNVSAVRQALDTVGVPVLAEEIGGDFGRSVRFNAGAGRVVVSSVYRDDVIL